MFYLYRIILFFMLSTIYIYPAQVTQGEGTSTGGTLSLSLDLGSSCVDETHSAVQGELSLCTVSKSSALTLDLGPRRQGELDVIKITIDGISTITKQEYYAPFDMDLNIAYNGDDRLFYYVESNNTNFIEATVDADGIIHISATQISAGVGVAKIMFIVFSEHEANSFYFDIVIEHSDFPDFSPLNFTQVSSQEWNEVAVLKVLNTFAFGGHATEAQVETWANMPSEYAIVQMLNFDSNNDLLSPSTDKLPQTSSLEELAEFWNSDSEDNYIDTSLRDDYAKDDWYALYGSWYMAVLSRGLNPFLHRVGLWETNYHMSANRDAGVHAYPMFHHYDNIVASLASNSAYSSVIAQGAKNSAIAFQYGHNYNTYIDGIFRGNEDFAREYHQLFFGILGEYDHNYHELTAIPNTARALTDMYARWHNNTDGGPDAEIAFGTGEHYAPDLDILNSNISGVDASYKIDNIAAVAIDHSESKSNLPVMIIEHFADNNLSAETIARLRSSWDMMSPKKLLPFIWAYAVSTDFHNEKRYKYLTSIERTMSVFSKMVVDNSDNIYRRYEPSYYLSHEEISVFSPIHDVFGHQTALEASDNPNVFKANYNRSVAKRWLYTDAHKCLRDGNNDCVDDSNGIEITVWEKDWTNKIPSNDNGKYIVEDVARWLWEYFIGDGGKNYGVLERTHIVTLLNGKDLALFIDEDDPLHLYSLDDITNNSSIVHAINDGAVASLDLNSEDIEDRRDANERVGLAIAFIVATPYIYVQEGK